MKMMKILSPTAILGYGYPRESFQRGLTLQPDAIAVDAGSTDPGPYYLGAGRSFTQKDAVKRDLVPMLEAARDRSLPVLISSAGGSGARPHLEWLWDIILEIYREGNFSLRTGAIAADISKETVLDGLRQGRIAPCGPVPPLTEAAIESASHIVAQMGAEPVLEAIAAGFQVIVTGRAYDPVPFAALPLFHGFDPGLALHMGKILECAAIAADPGSGSDCMLGTITEESFVVEALNPARRCTRRSVAAHTLYEKSNPYRLAGPGGVLNLENTTFTEAEGGRVIVRGSRFEPTPYAVKLEAAALVGYRSLSLAGIRDPIMLRQLDDILQTVTAYVEQQLQLASGETLLFHCYGKDGVMGQREPEPSAGHEVGLVIEAAAADQERAAAICGFARSTLLHYGYPGRISTAGNLAFPYSPSDFAAGPVYRFVIHHLLAVDDATALFPLIKEVG